jgi:hypothetical protein
MTGIGSRGVDGREGRKEEERRGKAKGKRRTQKVGSAHGSFYVAPKILAMGTRRRLT